MRHVTQYSDGGQSETHLAPAPASGGKHYMPSNSNILRALRAAHGQYTIDLVSLHSVLGWTNNVSYCNAYVCSIELHSTSNVYNYTDSDVQMSFRMIIIYFIKM